MKVAAAAAAAAVSNLNAITHWWFLGMEWGIGLRMGLRVTLTVVSQKGF